jgi:hypothetical protein
MGPSLQTFELAAWCRSRRIDAPDESMLRAVFEERDTSAADASWYKRQRDDALTLVEDRGKALGAAIEQSTRWKRRHDHSTAALEALIAGIEDSVMRFLDQHELSLRPDMEAVLRARVERARAALAMAKEKSK